MSGRSKKYQNEKINEEQTVIEETETTENNATDSVPEEESQTEDETDLSRLEEKISKLENEAFEYRDKLIRKAAEFENYKKRTSEEYIRLIGTANEELILKLLPVLDDIERFQKNYSDKTNVSDLNKGVDMIFEKLGYILKNQGLSEIEALNTAFDPELHDAMMTMEKEGVEPNYVVDQYEKGYKLNDKVIRHSKVIVSK
ncbi:MAG: nucleotide exchange factor GrpE [Candidatus Delongbacteria bacterium]|nr:nucleotide exchange factor GrpE [Candidatus Delongbacteria bacterium]MDD4204572.1 nucleotide exchange factor GrpE [Candidatus Delongbacteria bacterium]